MDKPISSLEPNIGWLSPDGQYYPCEITSTSYLSGGHQQKALEICAFLFPDFVPEGYHTHQLYLIQSGWIRTDYDSTWVGEDQIPTPAQIRTLYALWQKKGARFSRDSVKELIERYGAFLVEGG